tara:strand:+ start:721 stop:939 length:219 start_codon:yes stop_codon:yes gene_type:complete
MVTLLSEPLPSRITKEGALFNPQITKLWGVSNEFIILTDLLEGILSNFLIILDETVSHKEVNNINSLDPENF